MPAARKDLAALVRKLHDIPEGEIPLHAPVFTGNERAYLLRCLETTYVSSVGEYVGRFEAMLCDITGVRHAVACACGTAALEMALRAAGVGSGDLVVTQALSFVATANAIFHCGALPVFVDVDADTLGMSPAALEDFLEHDCAARDGVLRHRTTGRRVAACVPMHTFGHPCRVPALLEAAGKRGVCLVEDAAEALGSRLSGRPTGGFGLAGVLSFNGNKICTGGGGGAVLTNDKPLADWVRRATTTAKIPHPWEYRHDMPAWNLRLTNLAAALACAQLERLDDFLADKRALADEYAAGLCDSPYLFFHEPPNTRSNYWLNAVRVGDRDERDALLAFLHDDGIMARPVWEPLCDLPMYARCPCGDLPETRRLSACLINLPSGVRPARLPTRTIPT